MDSESFFYLSGVIVGALLVFAGMGAATFLRWLAHK